MKLKLGLFALLVVCNSVSINANTPSKTTDLPKAKDPLHLDWLDTSVSPSEDFYAYANGNWQKNNPIPPEHASWGSFNVVNEKVQKQLHQMLKDAASNTNAKKGSIEQKIGDFYFSGMDEASINKLGIKPLQPELARIEAIDSLTSFQKAMAYFHQMGVNALFDFESMQDFKDSTVMVGAAVQGGLGLPNRDYYLKDDPKFQKIREAYVAHIGTMFQLLGEDSKQSQLKAKTVMDIETRLAKASMSPVELRDPHAIYHVMDVDAIEKMTPNFSWRNYLNARGQGNLKEFNLAMPHFFKEVNAMLRDVSLDHWKTYLRWHLINSFASYLSTPFVEQNFKMAQVLTGIEKMQPRWKRVVRTENQALGFAIGQLYVERYFSAKDKENVLDIIKNIRAVLREGINTLSWMTPDTRKAALTKLDKMEERVGYPSKWLDYSSLKIDRGPYVNNVIRANQFLVARDLAKIGKPIDRTEWAMTPQTINAYYDPSMNNLNIPAGILQPPFYDPDAPAAVNYGAIGFVVGHEMTHGFDDQGAQFDADGNLKNWWTEGDLKQFKTATQCIVDQFSKFKVEGDLPVQGQLVVGEATADLGGITIANRAFHRSKDYQTAPVIQGMTPDQQFFLGVAHAWAMNMRPEQIRNQVTTDPHPPAKFRVNGSLANSLEFQKAFGLSESSPMVNKNRCVIW